MCFYDFVQNLHEVFFEERNFTQILHKVPPTDRKQPHAESARGCF